MKVTNQIVTELARKLGFDLIGFSKADELVEEIENLEKWIEIGYQAGMQYMENNLDKKGDVKEILPDAKSVISLGMNYYTDEDYSGDSHRDGFPESKGKVSRYAWGKDYHLIIWEKLEKLEKELKSIDNNFNSKSYVDTGPVMDKAWAVKSGIGWLGKHTNVINREIGSWFFIANIITNYKFEYNQPLQDFCGSCTACIEACPTDAIVQEYVVDSNRCISYLTIENKGTIPKEFEDKFDSWAFGCDICQNVCPWNDKFSRITDNKDFLPTNKEITLADIDGLSNRTFNQKFAESPIKRARLKGLKRNLTFIKV